MKFGPGVTCTANPPVIHGNTGSEKHMSEYLKRESTRPFVAVDDDLVALLNHRGSDVRCVRRCDLKDRHELKPGSYGCA